MSEPLPPPLPEDLEPFLQAERSEREPPGVKDRVLQRLEAKLPLGTERDVHLAWSRRARQRPQFLRWFARASVGGALGAAQLAAAIGTGGAVVVGVGALIQHTVRVKRAQERAAHEGKVAHPGARAPVVDQAPSLPAAPAPLPALPPPISPPPEPNPGAVAHPGVSPPEHRSAPAVREAVPAEAPLPDRNGAIAEDRTLLEQARVALLRGDTAAALEALTTHAEKFPASPFTEEREALMVREAVRAGSYKEARAWFEKFRNHYPSSPLLPVLESSLKALPHEE